MQTRTSRHAHVSRRTAVRRALIVALTGVAVLAPAGGALAGDRVPSSDARDVSDAKLGPDQLVAVDGSGPSAGPVIPVEGPDGLLWLCREDEEAQQSICIPWAQGLEPSSPEPALTG
ncbi:MAG: hypothetical protein Q8O56_15055 [Solirubrobacteraceae bacterium]|nr:hypothetical protein [Solirubrobacteraceae bacterium]